MNQCAFFTLPRYNRAMEIGEFRPTTNLYDLSRVELGELLAGWGYSDYYATLLWRGLYREQVTAVTTIHGLRPDLVTHLSDETHLGLLPVQTATDSSDGFTQKFLLHLTR